VWRSPNGTIRGFVNGTIFREPIVIPRIPRLVPAWKEPIIVAGHAFGDQYHSKEIFVEGEGTLEMLYTPKNGRPTLIKVFEFPSSGGVALTQYNTVESVTGFARACFDMALERNMPVYFGTKYTVLTIYDGMFKSIFQKVYNSEYQLRFESRGLSYNHLIIDDLVIRMLKMSGPAILAMKNYDGDVFSDQVASGFGSVGLMTSSLVSPDRKTYMFEASHGTVSKHYHQYLAGQEMSTNPIALLFAWTRAFARIGQSEKADDLISWAGRLEEAAIKTVDRDQIMTRDLANACGKRERRDHVTTTDFMAAVEDRFRGTS
jgi:isocitrate dehydrogenase